MTFQNYRSSDYEAVCSFLVELNRETRDHINWNWARFEWMAEHPEFDKTLSGAMGLWRDGGRVVGAALYDMYFGEAFCGVLPAWGDLYPAVLSYAWDALRDENGLGVAICDGNDRERAAALAAGFAPARQTETVMARELDRLSPAALPAGFTCAELDPAEDPESFQWLLWQGFDHSPDRAAFEAAELERTARQDLRPRPHFDRRLSLAAVGPDGEKAAYCCLWYLPGTDYAYVEPVCTVPAHRGRGLAPALLTLAMERAAALGAERSYVISDLPFYEKLGFATDRRFTFYWKR